MNLKKLGKILLFPHIAVMTVLVPVSAVFLIYSMTVFGSEAPQTIASYVLSAYTLTVWCARSPYIIKGFKTFKNENKYARRWQDNIRLRVNVSLYGSFTWNALYALFQLWLGIIHSSFWFYSLAGYYIFLAVMRFYLVRHTRRYKPGEKMRNELIKYRACGVIFLLMNIALSVMIFFMVYWNKTSRHHEITTIMMAAYTFTTFTVAIVNLIRYRKYNSPVYSASKAISLASACVSMLTLESTMLTTWEQNENADFRQIMLGFTGIAVIAFIIVMAINMIKSGNRRLKALENEQYKDLKEKTSNG